MVRLEPRGRLEQATWEALINLCELRPDGWTLIGAQMVALHALEKGYLPPRASRDLDVLANVRVMSNATAQISKTLLEEGFELIEPSLSGIAHKFVRGDAIIDVLAPDGLGPKTKVFTSPPFRTVLVPGGTQALKRSAHVEVELDSRRAKVMRPNLLGAILLKARAIRVSDAPDAQRRDLAFLCCMIEDPRSLAQRLTRKERGWLKRQNDNLLDSETLWFGLPNSDNGKIALELLVETSLP